METARPRAEHAVMVLFFRDEGVPSPYEFCGSGTKQTLFHCDRLETARPRAECAVMVSFFGTRASRPHTIFRWNCGGGDRWLTRALL